MNNILNSRFIVLATQDNNNTEISNQELVNSYNEFFNQLTDIVDSESSYPIIYRLLSELEAIFSLSIEQLRGCSNSLKKICNKISYKTCS